MTFTKFILALAAACTLAFAAQGVNAASLNPVAGALKENAAGWSIVQKTHGCHASCKLWKPAASPFWHRHSRPSCASQRCRMRLLWGKPRDPATCKERGGKWVCRITCFPSKDGRTEDCRRTCRCVFP